MSGENVAGAKWFEQRVAEWRSAGARLRGLEHGKSAPAANVLEAVRAYPEIARDLALARREAPNAALTKYLEGVYRELHRSLFRPPAAFWRGVLRLFTHDAAAAARELRWQIGVVVSLFAVCIGAGAWLDEQQGNRDKAVAIAAGRNFFNQDPKILQFVMENPTDRETYGDLRMIRAEFEDLMQLSIEAGTIKHPIAYETYIDERFVRAQKTATIPL